MPVTSATEALIMAATMVARPLAAATPGRPAQPAGAFREGAGELLLDAFAGDAFDEREFDRLQEVATLAGKVGDGFRHPRFFPSEANCASRCPEVAATGCGDRSRATATACSTCGWTVSRSLVSTSCWKSCCHCARVQSRRQVFQKESLSSIKALPWSAQSRQARSTPRRKPATWRRVCSLRTCTKLVTRSRCLSSRVMNSKLPRISSAKSPGPSSCWFARWRPASSCARHFRRRCG